jgi:CubicO group peptidase (beta-lactamase class C family)
MSGRVERILARLVSGAPDRGPSAAVCAVARYGTLVAEVAVGVSQASDGGRPLADPPPVTARTRFDVGSVTKAVATTALVMTLRARGRLDLDAPVATWLPGFTGDGRELVTPRHLLLHRGGLWEWWPTYVHAGDRDAALALVRRLPLRYPPGAGHHYSDLGFMLLGAVVEEAAGEPLDALARREVFGPLGMAATGYRRRGDPAPDPVAATSTGDAYERSMVATGEPYPVAEDPAAFAGWRAHVLRGEVNDGNAFHAFQGVAGHAGLLTTAADLCRFGGALLGALGSGWPDPGSAGGASPWPGAVVREFLAAGPDPGQALGFQLRRAGGCRVAGHSGFPGAELAVVPERGVVVALLTNRLHPQSTPVEIEPAWAAILDVVLGGGLDSAPEHSAQGRGTHQPCA